MPLRGDNRGRQCRRRDRVHRQCGRLAADFRGHDLLRLTAGLNVAGRCGRFVKRRLLTMVVLGIFDFDFLLVDVIGLGHLHTE